MKSLMESVGGKVITFDYCFGEFDIVIILDLPDDTTMASLVMTVAATGAATNLRTTVLIPSADLFAAAQKANGITYRPPGQ